MIHLTSKQNSTAPHSYRAAKGAMHSIGCRQGTGRERVVQDDCIRYEAPSSATTLTTGICEPCIQTQITCHTHCDRRLCDELNNTTSLFDLLLGLGTDVAGADDDGDLGQTTLSKDLGVAKVEDVEDGSVATLVSEVCVALLGRDERPELVEVDHGLPESILHLVDCDVASAAACREGERSSATGQLTVTHSDLAEVTGMVLVNVGPVVVLTTGHTTTTGVLPLCACQQAVAGRRRL